MGTPMTYISGNTGTYQSGTFNKGSIALNLNPTSLASGNNWYNGVDVTATQYLIYSDTYSQGQATVANSKPTAWTTPDLSDTSLLNLINTLPDRVGVLPFTSLPLALQWLNATNKYFLIKTNFENIVTSNLKLNLDPAWYTSYVGTGTAWNDLSGNNNNFTLINSVSYETLQQGCLSFDGTNDIATGTVSTLNTGGGQYNTVTFWMYLRGGNGGFPFELGGYRLWVPGDNFGFNTGNSDIYGISSSQLIDKWVHVAAIFYNGAYTNNNKLYINGVLQTLTQRLGNASSGSAGTSIAIGGYQGGYTSYPFYGKIGPIQMYAGELSDSQVQQNYNAQKLRFGFYDFVQSGLTYSYDAGNYLSFPRSGTTWSNMSNGSNNGTLTNGPVWSSNSGGTITFDGSDDYVAAGSGKTLNNMTVQMSVSVLSNAGGYKGFAGAVGGGNDFDSGFNIDMQGGSTASFSQCSIEGGFLRVGGGTNFMTSSVPFGQWKNICFTISPTYIQFYLDGIKQFGTNRLNNASSTIGMNSLVIGARPYSLPNTSINANIRDVIIYDRALGDSEVVQNFEASRKNNVGLTGYTTNGLVLNLDAGNYASYPTTGTKWVDISGSYNNGTLTNGPVWSNSSGGTFTFDGVDDYVNVGVNKNCNQFTGDFAVCAWVNRSNLGGTWGNIIGDYYTNSTANALEWQLMVNNSNNLFVYNVTNGYVFAPISTGIAINTWMYVTLTRIGSTLKLYANTTEIASTTNTTTFGSSTGNLNIGIDGNNSSEPFTGKIANVMIYKNKGLTSAEIIQNYNALKGRFGL